MNDTTEMTAYGCLYHDIGKILYRAGHQGTHSQLGFAYMKKMAPGLSKDELDAIRLHHGRELRSAKISKKSLAYISYIADNISAGFDRREKNDETPQFKRYVPLSSIFTHLNGEHPDHYLYPNPDSKSDFVMPSSDKHMLEQRVYQRLEQVLNENLSQMEFGKEWINSHLAMLETLTSSIPSSTNVSESVDISLFDHLKTTAAVGCCISEYLSENGVEDYKQELLDDEKKFKEKKVFLLYSADMSGIQSFIYTVGKEQALKNLRSRSFFLDLLMEHYVDELLSYTGLARMNLLYSGGGHCYLLLPNTEKTINEITAVHQKFKSWLMDHFGIQLYIADGYAACSANDLMNQPSEKKPYRHIFHEVSEKIAYQKLHRYTAEEIQSMNHCSNDIAKRECKICGRSDHLSKDGLCDWCTVFRDISEKIRTKSVYYLTRTKQDADFVLPGMEGNIYVIITDVEQARKRLKSDAGVERIYVKNSAHTGFAYATRLHIGDYASDIWLNKLAEKSSGIERLGVCRMDVDNLGDAFIRGFEKTGSAPDRMKYVTISRVSAFSRQMSMFFKNYINTILAGRSSNEKPLNVLIVYSGGDDVFLTGAWNDVIEASERIEQAFEEFSCGALTLSAGIGIYGAKYPIRLAAEKTGELENCAKKYPDPDHPKKKAITLFEPSQTYSWREYHTSVVGEKLKAIQNFFDRDRRQKGERGMAFLYRIVELLRHADEEKLNLARLAYVLSRLEPSKNSPQYEAYTAMSYHIYKWALNPTDRKQTITAIYIYVYLNRTRKEVEK